ncbi:hypothetical protein B0H11DRAFT_2050148 [Mycena galericulata]|nr:hypothetical protein B0H11DRAFT_2050148 [Mycena galericulata]
MSSTNQRNAETFLSDLILINKGRLDLNSYVWPVIDYREVNTATCQSILSLIGDDTEPYAGRLDAIPETPRKQQIARAVNLQVTERAYLAARRVVDAKALEEAIVGSLEPILQWLKGARQPEIKWTSSEFRLLQKLGMVRDALDKVEELIIGNPEDDATESESEAGDRTRVAYK